MKWPALRVLVLVTAAALLTQPLARGGGTKKQGKLNIGIEMDSSLAEAESGPWLGYLLARANYIAEHEADYIGHRGPLPPRFAEEVEARGTAATIYSELKQKDPDLDIRYFNDLVRVQGAGFLQEYVWIYLHQDAWAQPTDLKLDGFEPWRAANLADHKVETRGRITLGEPE